MVKSLTIKRKVTEIKNGEFIKIKRQVTEMKIDYINRNDRKMKRFS